MLKPVGTRWRLRQSSSFSDQFLLIGGPLASFCVITVGGRRDTVDWDGTVSGAGGPVAPQTGGCRDCSLTGVVGDAAGCQTAALVGGG